MVYYLFSFITVVVNVHKSVRTLVHPLILNFSAFYTRMSFSRRPTCRLPIGSQVLTIWLWNDLDLSMTLPSFMTLTSYPGTKLTFSIRWLWTWPSDLDTQIWPRYGQDVTPHQNWSFYVNSFTHYSLNRQTDRQTQTDTHTRRKHYLFRIRGR